METKKASITPENYTRAIISLSRRYASTSAFPGNNYVDIGEWMLQDRKLPNSAKSEEDISLFASKSEQPHDLVVIYSSGEKRWGIKQYSQEQHETFSTSTSVRNEEALGQIIFIRGFISPSWVAAIGSKYNIDPEFFRRHMDFLSASVLRHSFSFPSLASSSNNIFRLCVSTILHREDFGGQDLQSQRSEQSTGLRNYKLRQLGSTRICCGDSLVREYSTVCSSFSVIEQWISLCIVKTDKGWTVVAWMDQGRPLEQSPPGPWTSHFSAQATPLPILQHHPKMAFRTTTNRLDPGANASAEVVQSTAVLPLQYDSLLALVDLARRARNDPLFMCIPLFTHAAFSEVQFLNLMESSIQIQINAIAGGIPADVLGTLQFFSEILNRHAEQLKDSIRALHKLAERSSQVLKADNLMFQGVTPPSLGQNSHRQSLRTDGARTIEPSSSDNAFRPRSLLEDYEQLYDRCIDLSKTCTRGITLAMNKAAIEESHKAIEQSERLKKLTLLATLFIPLSFTSSLLGMNIDLLGQKAVKFWWFFVLCIPITLLAYTFYLWDFRTLKNIRRSLWKRCRHIRELATGATASEKDQSHVV
ncbi:putative pseudouridine 5'-phosphatase [Microsporum canis]